MINIDNIKVWKVGSRWDNVGNPNASILDIFRKYNIAFVGKAPDSIFTVKIGDLVAIGDGNTIVSVGIVTSEPKPITEMMSIFEEEDQTEKRFDLADWVTAFRVVLFDLEVKDYIDYPSRQKFHSAGSSYEKKIKDLVFNNFIYFTKYKGKWLIPNSIQQIKISNYQGIKNIHIKDIPVNTQWIFLTGENGFGKTSILQAIVIGLYGNKDEGQLLDKNEKIKSLIEVGQEIKYSQTENDIKFDDFVAYGPSRLSITNDKTSKTSSLFNTDSKLINIERYLREWFDTKEKHHLYERTRKILLDLLEPYIVDINVIYGKDETKIVKYFEKESDNSEGLEYHQLAAGCKNLIAFVGDMIVRLSETQSWNDYFDFEGIVIIDEFDNHLHPKWQRDLVKKLSDWFRKIQFIVSTHSPIPFLGAPKNSVFIKVDRNKEQGITAEILDIDISTLSPTSILTSPIFGFLSIIPEMHDGTKFIETEKYYDKIQENKNIDKEIEAYLSKERMERFAQILKSGEK